MRALSRHLLAAGLVALAAMALASCGDDGDGARRASKPLLIAAASDLRPAFTELAQQYERRTGQRVTLTFGASGQLAKQLTSGAPYALFASASIDYVDEVLAAGRGDRSTRAIYAYGRLAVWDPERDIALSDLASPQIKTVAIANPEHAPYGKAAVEALRASGLWARVQRKLVYGDNVAATQQLAASGNADAAIIAQALARSSGGHATPIDASLHRPIAQGLLVTGTGTAAEHAREFVRVLRAPAGQAVLRKDGFVLPGAAPSGER